MSDNAEAGIARVQAAAAKSQGVEGAGLGNYQKQSIAYLDERIVVLILAIAVIALVVVWTTTTSTLQLYGSLIGVIILTIVWGIARVHQIKRVREIRTEQVSSYNSRAKK